MKIRSKIAVAVIGIGNCANSFVQGLEYYKDIDETSPPVSGLMHNTFGGYLLRDIKIVAAFDVNANKVGKDIADSIWVHPSNSRKFADVPVLGARVSAGFLGDGIAPHMQSYFPLKEDPDHVLSVLKESGAEICISYLPAGSKEATRFYAEACLDSGIGFINGMPEFIASDEGWAEKFRQAGVPCAGDDIQSQIGATIIHRALVNLIRERGLIVDDTYQLDIGGNMDFDNLTDHARVASKKISKTDAVVHEAGTANVRVVPADYISFLQDNKIAYINVRGRQFGDIPFEIELKMSVDDSPNNAGVMVDAVRAMKVSLDRGLVGYQKWSAYFFKHPLYFVPINDARCIVDDFIANKGSKDRAR